MPPFTKKSAPPVKPALKASAGHQEHHTRAAECCDKAAAEHRQAAKCCGAGDHKKAGEHAKQARDHRMKAQDHGKKAMAA